MTWKAEAPKAWDSPSWRKAAREYHDARAGRALIVEKPEPGRLKQLLDLLNDSISFYAAYYANRKSDRAPQTVVESLMLGLRERGTKALEEPAVKRLLSELSDQQVIEVGDRLQKLKPEIARAWSPKEIKILLQARTK